MTPVGPWPGSAQIPGCWPLALMLACACSATRQGTGGSSRGAERPLGTSPALARRTGGVGLWPWAVRGDLARRPSPPPSRPAGQGLVLCMAVEHLVLVDFGERAAGCPVSASRAAALPSCTGSCPRDLSAVRSEPWCVRRPSLSMRRGLLTPRVMSAAAPASRPPPRATPWEPAPLGV